MICPVCLWTVFESRNILSDRLIKQWEMTPDQVEYINNQQGTHCTRCNNNIRTMTLAHAIMKHFGYSGAFKNFVKEDGIWQDRLFLEINPCGALGHTEHLKNIIRFSYPTIDMANMKFQDDSIDYIIHSDTLEHVEDGPVVALHECWRVLKPGGSLFFTIPILHERLSRYRLGMEKSFHGDDSLVHWEFGANFYTMPFEAGFRTLSLITLMDNATFTIRCDK